MEKNIMSETTESLKAAINTFLDENQKFEDGNGAAGTRARKALQEVTKLCKTRRAEITETKNARKEAKLNG
jgi:hypothetical protein